jgi:predicted transcriptional regulator of viral defense system
LFKPDYAGGIVEVARAIYISKEKIKFDTLLDYTKKFKSQAVIKRLGFLLELLEINNNREITKSKNGFLCFTRYGITKIGKTN